MIFRIDIAIHIPVEGHSRASGKNHAQEHQEKEAPIRFAAFNPYGEEEGKESKRQGKNRVGKFDQGEICLHAIKIKMPAKKTSLQALISCNGGYRLVFRQLSWFYSRSVWILLDITGDIEEGLGRNGVCIHSYALSLFAWFAFAVKLNIDNA